MRQLALFLLAGLLIATPVSIGGRARQAAHPPYRTLNDRFAPPEFTSLADWQRRAAYLREHILATAGLMPMPEKSPLRAQVFGEQKRERYSVSKVYFESLMGFYVTGNLYRPAGDGPFPAILSPHGHWTYGRLENTQLASVPGRAINLAEQGFVVFAYDMIGYNDSRQLPHDFGGKRENLWGLSLAGLQLWNSIRSLDFLESLPYVDRTRLGATGASGGGTQTFLLAAVDDRIKAVAPVNMISLHMQGGCLCENQPGLRLDTNNVEIAAAIAPRPLLMVSATGDWTKETMTLEYPAMRRIYALEGAQDRVHAVQFDAPHNYNRDSREAVYAWMARWLKGAPATVRVTERSYRPESLADALVFHGRALPEHALTRAQLVDQWIRSAKQQLRTADARTLQSALSHALAPAVARRPGPERAPTAGESDKRSPTVLVAGVSSTLEAALSAAGIAASRVPETPFDAAAAAKIPHFETYNPTPALQRVADIVQAAALHSNVTLIADGEWGLAALLARAVLPIDRLIVDVARFDSTRDDAFVEQLYIPGIRRAGDLQTAVTMGSGEIVIHNAAKSFTLAGSRIEARVLAPSEIVSLVKRSP